MPIYEWEGLLYVASDLNDLLETPPTEWPSHWILVEASSSDLENLWVEFNESSDSSDSSFHTNTNAIQQPQTNSASGIPNLPEIPNLATPSDEPSVSVVAGDDFSDELQIVSDILVPKKGSAPKEIKDFAIEEPQPKAQAEMDDLESLMNSEPEPLESKEENSQVSSADMLEGLSLDVGPVKLGKVEGALPEIPEVSEIPGPVPEDTLPPVPRASLQKKSTPPPIHREVDELTPTPPPMVPTPPQVTEAHAQDPILDSLPANSPAEKPSAAVSAKAEPFPDLDSGTKSAIKIEVPVGDIPHEERLLMDQLPKAYQRSFLALKAGNSLRLVSWPRDLTGELATKEKDFSLNPPSPFRIALRTEKSYHGYLIQTSFMTQFFLGWNGNQYPETLTVAPVKADQMIVGFVIALGTKDAEKKSALQAVEKVASIIGEKWKKIGPQFSKAA